MASNSTWGGMPFLIPSPTCHKYLRTQTQVVPEGSIRIGARYRARRNLVENVRGYRAVKKSLQRKLAEIESDRKNAHYQLPEMGNIIHKIFMTSGSVDMFEKPRNSCTFCPTYSSRCPLFRKKVQIGQTEPRMEDVLGMVDIRKRMAKNPSERLKREKTDDNVSPTAKLAVLLGLETKERSLRSF